MFAAPAKNTLGVRLVGLAIAAWIVTILLAVRPSAAEDAGAILATLGVTAIPGSSQMPPDVAAAYDRALGISDEQLDTLAGSDDPIARGLAIAVAYERGDLQRLVAWRGFLEDYRASLPYCRRGASLVPQYAYIPSTVSQHINAALSHWLGFDPNCRLEKLEERFLSRVESIDRLVRPWWVRLQRATNLGLEDTDTAQEVRQAIADLAPDLRWAIVAVCHRDNMYTDAQAAAVYLALPADIKANIESGVRMLSFDPTYSLDDDRRAREDELQVHARAILELADSLPINPPPDPPPPPP